jgi:hypothetical protein
VYACLPFVVPIIFCYYSFEHSPSKDRARTLKPGMHEITVFEGESHLVVNSRIDISCPWSTRVEESREYDAVIVDVLPTAHDNGGNISTASGALAITRHASAALPQVSLV